MTGERYFGLHFDFHASDGCPIGTRTDPADIEWYIDEAQPDFIQCDCKGHPGITSYPTGVGRAADGLVRDNLKIWADTVHGRGLPLYVHYSGVYEKAYTDAHPNQAAVGEDGRPTDGASVFGNYCEELMIPQLKEVIDLYGIDGAWIDGDCWWVFRDYSEMARKHLPEGFTHAEHNEVMRRGFFDYVRRYVDAIHAYKPDFRIASNWMYTAQTPVKPEIDVDFISGDFVPNNSAHTARFESRCMALQGKPWDLMAWGFAVDWQGGTHMDKPAEMLMQEAAVSISMGGGFQVYVTQNRDGSARRERSGRFRALHGFMEPRRAINYGKPPAAQIGMYYSAKSRYAQTADDPSVFNPPHVSDALNGALHCVLDARYTLSCFYEHQLDTMPQYDAVIIPEWTMLTAPERDALLSYAREGGSLVVLGAETCRQLGEAAGLRFGELQKDARKAFVSHEGDMAAFQSDYLDLLEGEGRLYRGQDLRDEDIPARRIVPFGSGRIAFVPFGLGTVYYRCRTYYLQEYISDLLGKLCTPWIRINRSMIDLTVQQDGDARLINLVNLRQERQDSAYLVFESVPPVRDVELRLPRVCTEVSMPLGEKFEWLTENGETVIRIPELRIHSVVRVK